MIAVTSLEAILRMKIGRKVLSACTAVPNTAAGESDSSYAV